ncbi:MAG: SPASM domain-containing protein [Candidatus Bathyarchaeota archaeon]|nr:SPASM domain-containing protein [Candidatus Bathyarchaeota archaeon]
MKNNDVPLQLELHPGSHCGPLDCTFCYGKEQMLCEGTLSIKDYARLLDELLEYPPFIEISGIRSDPLSYSHFAQLIHAIKERKLNFGVHTKAYFLTDEVIQELNATSSEGSYITISVNSATADIYNNLHGLAPSSDTHQKLLQKVKKLHAAKTKNNSKLKINIAYLLMANNSSPEQIEAFVDLFEEHADVLKFSIPQVPNVAQPVNYLTPQKIETIFELLHNWRNGKITMLNFKNCEHDPNFKYCWAQRFNATIDKAGNVFPCPQVALKEYSHLIWGNISQQPFWDIWNSPKRHQMQTMLVDDMKCRVCDRKDENINLNLNGMMDADKYVLNVKKNTAQ